jgi:hypothetical protein
LRHSVGARHFGGSIINPRRKARGQRGRRESLARRTQRRQRRIQDFGLGAQPADHARSNPHYAGKAPAFKQVIFKIVREMSSRRLQLENGDADLIDQVPVDQAEP